MSGVQMMGEDGNIYTQPPSDTALIFYLKCKGKKRGYVERTEVTGADGGPIELITGMQFKSEKPNDNG